MKAALLSSVTGCALVAALPLRALARGPGGPVGGQVSDPHIVVMSTPDPGQEQRDRERVQAAEERSELDSAVDEPAPRGPSLPRGIDDREPQGTDWVAQIS
ncbi:MAG TPA: hypothetical protein VMB50_18515, partial [Myxococcales bacterium]|nr:hypothetical protein [Myxococcales bacterium]